MDRSQEARVRAGRVLVSAPEPSMLTFSDEAADALDLSENLTRMAMMIPRMGVFNAIQEYRRLEMLGPMIDPAGWAVKHQETKLRYRLALAVVDFLTALDAIAQEQREAKVA